MEDSNSPSILPSGPTLRRRMNILDRAHSLSNLNHSSSIEKGKGKSSPVALESHQDVHNIDEDEIEEVGSTDADYETESESSRTEGNGSPERSHSFTQRTGEDSQDGGQNFRSNSEQFEHRPLTHQPAQARSWYEFDLAVVAALVSPIGQWLTGGDHIKNLLLVMLLVFYLHQIIEIPWTLYYNARPRVKPHATRLPAAEDFHARRATSELRFLEFFFLSFAIVSPFLGAYLLRYVTFAVTGQDILSWFSLGLFVLATGVRPWSHLVQRFDQRVTDLHDIVHYHSSVKDAVSDDIVEMKQQLEELQGRMQEMQQSMTKLKKKLVKETNEAFDYVDEQVEPVEKMVQQHEKALEYVLQLRASLLNSRPSKSTSPKSLSPNASPSSSLKPLHSANHSGSSSPILTKLETIHEAIYEGMESKPSRPKSIDTVKINTPKSIYVKSHSSKTRTPFPRWSFDLLILFHALYAVTFPFRWCLRVFLRAMGMENVALQFQDVFSASFRANAFTNLNR
ncbi:hypothetical protein C8R42DRAFT_686794 [Lentinula raphanica]|nr:hypothetical protein C8R42DRAFT_686794 [Lentinula raphanica]